MDKFGGGRAAFETVDFQEPLARGESYQVSAIRTELAQKAGRMKHDVHQSEVGDDVEVEAAGCVHPARLPEPATGSAKHLPSHQPVGDVLDRHFARLQLGPLVKVRHSSVHDAANVVAAGVCDDRSG